MSAARFIVLAAFLALATKSLARPTSRIMGGEEAPTTAYPYVVSVRLDMAHLCGGSIISAKHILTAAHCVASSTTSTAVAVARVTVRVGSTNQFAGGKIVKVQKITIHPDYVDLKYDMAILELTENLVWTDRIGKVSYAKTAADEPAVDEMVNIAGWGEQGDGVAPFKLQHTTLTVATDDTCTDAFRDNDESIICLNHDSKHGSCYGDAGNGAVHNDMLVAVSNFIIGACGSRYPDVYSNVAYYADWIEETLGEDA